MRACRCVDCSGAGQSVFGQGGDLGYSLSLSATGARVRLPGAVSDGMRSAAVASDASAQYPNFAVVRWRVEFAGDIQVFANGELLGATDLGALPALSLSELGNLHNLTLGTANTSSASDFFTGTALEAATPPARGCIAVCGWLQPPCAHAVPPMCAGLVGELIVYDELLSDAHAAQVLEYLNTRWRPTPAQPRWPQPQAATLCVQAATQAATLRTPRWVPAPARWGSLTCVAGGTVNGVVKSGEHAGANITLPSALGQLSGLTRAMRPHPFDELVAGFIDRERKGLPCD